MRRVLVLAVLLSSGLVLAQTSTNFKLEEHTFNSGGTPSQGVQLTSVSFSVTLASIGDTVVATGLSSTVRGGCGLRRGLPACSGPAKVRS